ncbi:MULTISPECIES: DivIVA domain-containing protein [Micrococcales]|jgi:DivIVA domain-containing protein|uniref:Cell wall synthesis protein Wag31 n=2 Tax=Cellulomonas TaxID=1707 RepID=A0A919U3I1_9CELL|nr:MULTISPECIES: DivIVA domain-containing protein [Micrococcales]MBW0255712.1 DivIVA domain-containing protein [Cellulomonas sp. PS-H5]MCG7285549.1 DivIVA domain-containing protein [Cellulomonas sp. ACRRI]GIG37253.1 cell division protein DivIVA [Cellulomonas pakistanensis]HYQ75812.1 DivIVA domain-containing protein [Cellulomonas sp.]
MALLTADDVLNKKFQATKFREGYDQDEVDDFLDEVVNTLRETQSENEDLKSKLAAAERRIAELSRQGAQAAQAPKPEAEKPAPAPVPAAAPAPAPVATAPVAPQRQSEPESATGMLALAQKLHDDYVRSGQEEGDRIVNEAKGQAQRIVREAEETSARTLSELEQERSILERKIDELRVFERDYRTRLKSYLENLLGDLDNRASALPQRGAQGATPSV